MNLRRIALLIPYNKKSEILFQDRRELIKPVKKDYGFFGGEIEEGETIEQALAREIKEELSININKLKNLRFFKKYYYEIKELNIARELYVFLCDMPNLKKIKVNEGKAEVLKVENALKFNISDMDKKILKEIMALIKK